jgi:hypothetical protein
MDEHTLPPRWALTLGALNIFAVYLDGYVAYVAPQDLFYQLLVAHFGLEKDASSTPLG